MTVTPVLPLVRSTDIHRSPSGRGTLTSTHYVASYNHINLQSKTIELLKQQLKDAAERVEAAEKRAEERLAAAEKRAEERLEAAEKRADERRRDDLDALEKRLRAERQE
jgi:hypothetical protein